MSVLPILTYPDPRLKEISVNVEKVGDSIKKLVDDMLETMYHAKGIGLAAPQVGILSRILVIDIRRPIGSGKADRGDGHENGARDRDGDRDGDRDEDEEEESAFTELEKKVNFPLVLINPVILRGEGDTTYEEGCLSVPGYYEEVKRFNWVKVEAMDKEGVKYQLETDGLLAICIQHEMDHLEGKLFIDRLSFVKSNKIKNRIKKVGYPIKKEKEKESKGSEHSLSSKVKGPIEKTKMEV